MMWAGGVRIKESEKLVVCVSQHVSEAGGVRGGGQHSQSLSGVSGA